MDKSGSAGTCNEEQPSFVPQELVNVPSNASNITYHCYLMELQQNFKYDVSVEDVVLALTTELHSDILESPFEIYTTSGNLTVQLRYAETVVLSLTQVQRCRRFQVILLRILLDRYANGSDDVSDELCLGDDPKIDYLLLPATAKDQRLSNSVIDWESVGSASFSSQGTSGCENRGHNRLWTKNGLVCSCKLEKSLVSTPHNRYIYIITGSLKSDGNSIFRAKRTTYKKFFAGKKQPILLRHERQKLLKGSGVNVFKVKNFLGSEQQTTKGPGKMSAAELPPELCSIIMSPISVSTIYTFSFIPSIMHRLESLLLAFNLKMMLWDHCTQNDIHIPINKILEAITAKGCQESFNYESLETLGDSFLKYTTSQQLFKTYQSQREGFLTEERKKLISNNALSKLGSSHRLPGFIRNSQFDPKNWIIPGDKSGVVLSKEELVSNRTKVYDCGSRKLGSRIVADVVEALIGAFLGTGGEKTALMFVNRIGINVDFNIIPYEKNFSVEAEKFLDVASLKSCLNNYTFRDSSLLVEALTHGSFQRILPICYQRLEFLGDAVLDYLVTEHFYREYQKDMSPGLLTDMRSASVNKECYALSSIKAKLHKHILRDSRELDKQISDIVDKVKDLSSEITYGWQLDTYFPEVLEDVLESLAGAILIDSWYNKEVVFQSIGPLLKPLVTPDTVKLHPVRELRELCDKEKYILKEDVSLENDLKSVTIEVKAKRKRFKHTEMASNKRTARQSACKQVLKSLKETIFKG